MSRWLRLSIALSGAILFAAGLRAAVRADSLPERLSDQEFWNLSSSMSEPGGTFHSDNFVSNENGFQIVIPDLVKRVAPGGAYLGVGPEQNFTYIAVTRPKMVFILDIRRGNLHEHLLYKTHFEMAADRVDFAARLFCRDRPAGLAADAPVEAIFAALDRESTSPNRIAKQAAESIDWLKTKHGWTLSDEDRTGIEYVNQALCSAGPGIGYSLTVGQGGRSSGVGSADYAHLMTATDEQGTQWSYLSSPERFKIVQDLEAKNLVVPFVGNFGGPKALRAIGAYIKAHGATVSAFYTSNVEQYLRQDGIWTAFCESTATLPLTPSSTFIRSIRAGFPPVAGQPMFSRSSTGGGGFMSFLMPIAEDVKGCQSK